jgi:LysM repeat protein
MHTRSRLMLPLAISLAALQGCSTIDPNKQPAAQAAVSTPVAVPPKTAAPAAALAPVTPAKDDKVEASKPPASVVDRYTVMPGDTLALIAAKQEVYGDARLWPLLYRANVSQVGPDGLIFPKQVLVVNRNYTPEEAKALTGAPKKPAAPAPLSAKTPAASAPAAAATASTAPIAPVAAVDAPAAPAVAAVTAPSAPAATPPVPPAAASVAPAVATGKPSTALAPAGPAPRGAPVTSQTIKLSDYLRGAREAFAAGDSPWAIYYYSVYLEQKATDMNVWGELGNVYYLEGEYSEAAKAYFNVANLLIDRGQTVRALELIPVIEEGDAGLAAAIYQRLTTVKQ